MWAVTIALEYRTEPRQFEVGEAGIMDDSQYFHRLAIQKVRNF